MQMLTFKGRRIQDLVKQIRLACGPHGFIHSITKNTDGLVQIEVAVGDEVKGLSAQLSAVLADTTKALLGVQAKAVRPAAAWASKERLTGTVH
jgi:hypothetical protein